MACLPAAAKFESESLVSSPLLIADCELWPCRLGGPHPSGSLHAVDVRLVATTSVHSEAAGIQDSAPPRRAGNKLSYTCKTGSVKNHTCTHFHVECSLRCC